MSSVNPIVKGATVGAVTGAVLAELIVNNSGIEPGLFTTTVKTSIIAIATLTGAGLGYLLKMQRLIGETIDRKVLYP